MKTKNILKIGVFSIVLFALLISPILKFIAPETNAVELPDDPVLIKYCKDNSTMTLENNAQKQEYIEKCCAPEYDWGDNQVQQDIKCETLTGGVELISAMSSEEISTALEQESVDNICLETDYDKIIQQCAKGHGVVYKNTVCIAKASFAQIQCEIVTGILEGLGVMFGGIINSEIEWILTALNPATYGGIINTGVNAIWTTLRNIVNALLVLGLIGIAIATILGYKKYAWKQILWKLILIALLVNFSLVISGIVVDTSNYFTVYFLNMSQKNGSIAPRIMTGYGYTKDTTTNQYTSPELLGENKYKSSQINQDEVEKKGVGKFTVGLGNAFIIAFI